MTQVISKIDSDIRVKEAYQAMVGYLVKSRKEKGEC
jgi:hypothetical protein